MALSAADKLRRATEATREARDAAVRERDELRLQLDQMQAGIAEEVRAEVQKRVDKESAELREKLAELESLIGETGRESRSASPKRVRRQSRAKRSQRGAATSEAAILAYVRAQNEPVGAKAIMDGAQISMASASLSRRLKLMVESGQLKRTGEKRGTKYTVA